MPRSVAKIHLGQMEYFELGNLDSRRDWGHAKDYVVAMWHMLQLDQVIYPFYLLVHFQHATAGYRQPVKSNCGLLE